MRRAGYISVRQLAAFAVVLAAVAAVVAGVSVHRGTTLLARRDGIVSLSPALTDLLFEIGAGDQVSGVSDYARLPRGVTRPVVGDAMRINREMILWLRPRVIVIQQRPTEVLETLQREDGVAVEPIRIETLDDLRAAIRRLDEITGGAGGDRVIGRIDGDVAAVRKSVAGCNRPGVLLAINRDPVMAVGTGTFLDELIEAAGGRNVERHAGYVTLNDEQVAALAPQVIIEVAPQLAGASPETLTGRRESWCKLKSPAGQFGRVFVLTDAALTIPGAHVGRSAGEFARVIHPEAFETAATQPESPGGGK